MKDTPEILKLKGMELRTVDDVRAALFAIVHDIQSGALTAKESRPIRKEINVMMKEMSPRLKRGTTEDAKR